MPHLGQENGEQGLESNSGPPVQFHRVRSDFLSELSWGYLLHMVITLEMFGERFTREKRGLFSCVLWYWAPSLEGGAFSLPDRDRMASSPVVVPNEHQEIFSLAHLMEFRRHALLAP